MSTAPSPRKRTAYARWFVVTCLMIVGGAADAAAASAASGPVWAIHLLSQPTFFSATHNTGCLAAPNSDECDSYTVIAMNVGGGVASGPIVIADQLPQGLEVVNVKAENRDNGAVLTCDQMQAQCVYEDPTAPLAPGDALIMTVNVVVKGAVTENDAASVSVGGAPATSTSAPVDTGNATPPFGVASFDMQPFEDDGSLSSQAAGHPDALVTNIDFSTLLGSNEYVGPEEARDVIVDLPLGLLGNPLATPQCALSALQLTNGRSLCPKAASVGAVMVKAQGAGFALTGDKSSEATALYNMVPEPGYPAEFGFTFSNKPVLIYASLARVNGVYKLRTVSPGIVELGVDSTSLIFWGDPAEHNEGVTADRPFFTNPADCSTVPLKASIRADSWQRPGVYTSPLESVVYPRIAGCNALTFQPTLEVTPDTTQADAAAGYEVRVKVPQSEDPGSPATPELRDATVMLPPGVSVSPSAADGLRACKESGPEGINIEGPEAIEMGEGGRQGSPYINSPYHDGQEHIAPGHCPAASTIGTVEVKTPVLPDPLQGHVYLAEPKCGGVGQPACGEADASNGNLFGIYLEASGAGAIVKLHGTVSANPLTGQLTTTFTENPQLPFSELVLRLKGGPRAALANPQTCGQASTTSVLTPWSAPVTPDATPFNSFVVDWNGGGGACPASLPLAPSFSAGTVTPTAAGFSPFTLTLSRGDREQDVSQVAVHTPPGLLGLLSSVTLCQEPQAREGTCGAASQIGSTTAAVGPGTNPFWVQGGRVYLTGPYKGAPFGLSVVVPAVAGPFNLGNVVVRAVIDVDPDTTALTVTSDPLPQIVDGVPLRLRTLNVAVDRPGFFFNPTNCATSHITATVTGTQGATAGVSSPFTANGCRDLLFKTKFSASTQARTSKKEGASLDVKVTDAPGQANIAKVSVSLPKQLPSRLTTIQHACPDSVFAANPAACNPISLIGVARAVSPVLPVTLAGPAYLVSHGGAAFPDLVLVLQGDGVRVDLVGSINISRAGITSSTFASVPDVPIKSFELGLPKGRYSALTTANIPASAKGNLCGQKLALPTTIVAQNGAQIKQSTKLVITGCARAKKASGGKKRGRKAGSVDRSGR